MRVKDARQTFLGYWLRAVVSGERLMIFGDGEQRRDFNYVDDAVRAFLLAAVNEQANGQTYNLGDRHAVSLLELAETLVALNGGGGYELVPFPADRKAIDIGDYYADFTKIEETLGWTPTVPLAEGLRRSLAFYRQQAANYWDDSE
jgi:nucleoside-diphosphate-sugar epimerase